MADSEANETENRGSPWTRPGFMLAGGFAALMVMLLVAVLVFTSGGNNGGNGQAQPNPTPPISTTQPSGVVDDGQTSIPETPPADVTWQLYHTVALPVSRSAGPRVVTDSTAAHYAHTPTGALIAAAQITFR